MGISISGPYWLVYFSSFLFKPVLISIGQDAIAWHAWVSFDNAINLSHNKIKFKPAGWAAQFICSEDKLWLDLKKSLLMGKFTHVYAQWEVVLSPIRNVTY